MMMMLHDDLAVSRLWLQHVLVNHILQILTVHVNADAIPA